MKREIRFASLIFVVLTVFAMAGCDALRERQIPEGMESGAPRAEETRDTGNEKSAGGAAAVAKPNSPIRSGGAVASGRQRFVEVDRIIDGDTIHLSTGEKVRYIGVDTPELSRDGKQPEFYSDEATECNRRLLGTGPVKLVFDRGRKDKYGRLLAYVYSGAGFKTFVNAELLRQGCARVMSVPPNTRHADEFRDIEAAAKNRQAGLWAD